MIEWHAEALPCGQLRVTAERRAPVWVDGRRVGVTDWVGTPFVHDGPVRVAVERRRDVREVQSFVIDARATLTTTPVREGPVPIHVHVDSACPDLSWTVQLPTGPISGVGDADLAPVLGSGVVSVAVDLRRGDRVVASDRIAVAVGPACVDADGDGSCTTPFLDTADCDDADPRRRPGVPDPVGDGVDNDCDGRLAGDADGDRYESSIDCDDSDPTVFPGAVEVDDGRDDDCDGRVVGENPVRGYAGYDGAQLVAEPGVEVTPIHGRGWLVVVEEGSASMGGHVELFRTGFVVVPAEDGLRLILRLDLGIESRSAVWDGDVRVGSVVMSDTRIRPLVTPDGLVVGEDRYGWDGATLVR